MEGLGSAVGISLVLRISKSRRNETTLWLRRSDGDHSFVVNLRHVCLSVGNASHVFNTEQVSDLLCMLLVWDLKEDFF